MPQTLYYDNGGATESMATAGNFRVNSLTGSVSGAAPTDGDTLYFSGVDEEVLTGPGAAIDLALMVVSETFTANFGTAGSPITNIGVSSGSTAELRYLSAGAFGAIGDQTFDRATIAPVSSGAMFTAAGGTWTLANVVRGTVLFNTSAVVTTLKVLGGTVTAQLNGTPITLCEVASGTLRVSRNITTLFVKSGATVYLEGSCAVTTMYIERGGRVIDKSTGAHTTINVYPGASYDTSSLEGPKTITTVYRWAGATASLYGPSGALTVTNLFTPGTTGSYFGAGISLPS